MPKSIPEEELLAVKAVVAAAPASVTAQQIAVGLNAGIPIRTLQYRLRHMVEAGLLAREGEGRWVRYREPGHDSGPLLAGSGRTNTVAEDAIAEPESIDDPAAGHPGILSPRGAALYRFLRHRPAMRRPAGNRRRLLDTYRPNVSAYLSRRERFRLAAAGTVSGSAGPPGTAAQRLGQQFEIDLTWNSARLTASRYSELEVRRLIKFGRPGDGRDLVETQVVLNQRDALRFLLELRGDIALDRSTLCNLHAILAHNLLPDEAAAGRLRAVDNRSREEPLPSGEGGGVPIAATFARMLELAESIVDPFEQAFFVFVQIPYLAPFAELNDQVARYAVNVPLMRANFAPLSYVEMPAELYAHAIRAVVERSRIDLLKDLFLWGYEHSARRCGAGAPARITPDRFRLEHDALLRAAVAEVIRERVRRHALAIYLEDWAEDRVAPAARERFVQIVDAELRGLHEDNFARYPVTPREFRAWQAYWAEDCTDIHGLV